MVKIKDFTLASKNLGGGHVTPRAQWNSRPCRWASASGVARAGRCVARRAQEEVVICLCQHLKFSRSIARDVV